MTTTGMLQRCWVHDYCAPCFYMITLVTEPRRNCLSTVTVEADGAATVSLSPLGEIVRAVWRRTSAVYTGVEACQCVVMPDHFHGMLRVKKRLPRPMGHVVKAFKTVSRQECGSRGLLPQPNRERRGLLPQPNRERRGLLPQPNRAAANPAAGAAAGLWQAGFQDTILLRRGQLKAMVHYILDNPRRLAAKLANPELFTVVNHHAVFPGKGCPMLGNRFLLEHPIKRQVQVSRRVSVAGLAAQQAELLYTAAHGAVLVSPCISPGEKAIARAALNAGRPLIVLLANGFPPLYKPPGRYFDACAAGRLLMLAPFPYQRQRHPITRDQCLELNAWATRIATLPMPG